jgi:hypothetical protein
MRKSLAEMMRGPPQEWADQADEQSGSRKTDEVSMPMNSTRALKGAELASAITIGVLAFSVVAVLSTYLWAITHFDRRPEIFMP